MEAPIVDPFVGPAILRGKAAAVFFHEILGHRIEGHRQKDEDEGQTLTDKVGQSIFPDFITVVDDPTRTEFDGIDLNGHYRVDDEGAKAQTVSIVDKGVLQGFLMGRSPVENFPVSNGHGRRQTGYGTVARQGNLLVSAEESVSYDALKAQLIEEIKRQDKPFGLIFDDVSVDSPLLTELSQLLRGEAGHSLAGLSRWARRDGAWCRHDWCPSDYLLSHHGSQRRISGL